MHLHTASGTWIEEAFSGKARMAPPGHHATPRLHTDAREFAPCPVWPRVSFARSRLFSTSDKEI